MSEHQNNMELPWRVQVEEGAYPTLEQIVGQAIGAGSMCWTAINTAGEFQSEKASWVVNGAVEQIRKLIEIEATEQQASLEHQRDRLAQLFELKSTLLRRDEQLKASEALRLEMERSLNEKINERDAQIEEQGTRINELRAEIACQGLVNAPFPTVTTETPVPSDSWEEGEDGSPWAGARDDDKIYLLHTLLDTTSAQGTDMANFIRRIRLILGA